VFLINICCPKTTKNEEKKSNIQSRHFKRREWKKIKKKKRKSNMQNLSRTDMCQRGGSFPPFQMAVMRKTKKKKRTKIKSGSFWEINLMGVRFGIFLAYRVGIKKNRFFCALYDTYDMTICWWTNVLGDDFVKSLDSIWMWRSINSLFKCSVGFGLGSHLINMVRFSVKGNDDG